jgi:hypothetical protein
MDALKNTARNLANLGISTVPIADLTTKRPAVKWQPLQDRVPTDAEIDQWFTSAHGIALVCGTVQCLDLDIPADGSDEHLEAFENFAYATGMGDILAELPIQTSPSGGRHYFFRTSNPVGNTILARNSLGEVLIETRGKGGYVLIAPSDGYELDGDLTDIPTLDASDIDALLTNARAFDEGIQAVEVVSRPSMDGERPGDAYDRDTSAFFDLLRAHDWETVKSVNYWRRPGKRNGISATWDKIPNRFYVFSSSAHPLEAGKAYSPFAVFAILQHGGDFAAAAKDLAARGYGDKPTNTVERARESLQEAFTRMEAGIPPPRPFNTFTDEEKVMPEVVIDGLLYRGGKMLIGAPSKARKTWLLNHLALAMSNGGDWLGFQCHRHPVLYVDLELLPADALNRVESVSKATGFWDIADLHMWTLRGYAVTLQRIKGQMIDYCRKYDVGLIILDPFYRIAGGAVENSAEEIAVVLAEMESIVREANASLAMTHHFAKGNAAGKDAIDRFSGSGVFARDPDALIVLTEAEESDEQIPVFAMEMTVRSFAPPEPRAIAWQHPTWKLVRKGKVKLKKAAGRPSKFGPEDLLEGIPEKGIKTKELQTFLESEKGISRSKFYELKSEAESKGIIQSRNGLLISTLSSNEIRISGL